MNNLKDIFWLQKNNYSPAKAPSYEVRIDRINRLEQLVRKNIDVISRAVEADFGTRTADWVFTADIYPVLAHASHVKKALRKWMKPENKTPLAMRLIGQEEYIINEPLGVIGIMSPFNSPVSLAFDPAIDALAGGNTVIIKISESNPIISETLQKLVAEYFDPSEMAVVTGGFEVSKEFAALPWDKFMFTGGSETGKKILSAAADSLTPVILELGGKSPCIVLEDADIESAAEKIGKVRVLNAGQVCIAGDYALVAEKDLDEFVSTIVKSISASYPTIIDNKYFTSIINDAAYNRIKSYVDEAKSADAKVIEINPSNEPVPDPVSRKIPLTLVINPSEDLMVSKYEIFGPILSIYTYKSLDHALEMVNKREKALGLYVFGKDQKKIQYVVENTSSGGVTINDLMMHANAAQIGFGGVGYSGMGRYKGGFIGFQAFTNPKTVVKQGLMGRFTTMFFPPYKDERAKKMLRRQVGVK